MSTLKKFKRTKPLQVIRDQCKAAGVCINDTLFTKGQSDYIVLEGGNARVLFNTVNGRFFGETPDGTEFNSDKSKHEQCEWFQKLLAFFYTDEVMP